jgi:hypothetical protein
MNKEELIKELKRQIGMTLNTELYKKYVQAYAKITDNGKEAAVLVVEGRAWINLSEFCSMVDFPRGLIQNVTDATDTHIKKLTTMINIKPQGTRPRTFVMVEDLPWFIIHSNDDKMEKRVSCVMDIIYSILPKKYSGKIIKDTDTKVFTARNGHVTLRKQLSKLLNLTTGIKKKSNIFDKSDTERVGRLLIAIQERDKQIEKLENYIKELKNEKIERKQYVKLANILDELGFIIQLIPKEA